MSSVQLRTASGATLPTFVSNVSPILFCSQTHFACLMSFYQLAIGSASFRIMELASDARTGLLKKAILVLHAQMPDASNVLILQSANSV